MTIRSLNLRKRRLPCLRCGKLFWTDRCHRICKKCTADGREPYVREMVSAVGISLLCDSRLAEESGLSSFSESFDDGSSEEV